MKIGNRVYKEKIKTLDLPTYSPDLSPIENIWDIMSNVMKQKDTRNQLELINEVEKVWNEVDQEKSITLLTKYPLEL